MKAAGWLAVSVVGILCLTSTACSSDTQPQKDLSDRLEKVAAAKGPPSYFLGRSYAGIDLFAVEDEGADYSYGSCDTSGGGCGSPIQVHNGPVNLTGDVRGCSRLPEIRGVPAVSWGDGLVLFTHNSAVSIAEHVTGEDLRSMAEALRPVSGPADTTKPLPAPAKDMLDTIATKCGASPGDQGKPIED